MAAINESAAALRIYGDTLNPEEVSQLLGCRPSDAYVKGQIEPSKFHVITRKTGAWILDAKRRVPGDVDAQVAEIFSQLTPDLAVWSALSKNYVMDLFCGLFMTEAGEGFELSLETMKTLADRGIKIGICLYAPTEVLPTDPCPCDSGKTYAECCALK
jgi:hypothetical protein